VKATASLGIASTEAFGHELDTLMRRADMAVYAAKRAGRNRVVVATLSDEMPAAVDEMFSEPEAPMTHRVGVAT
jgi:predicted signal transduction protein with EAL and GGDEF domain